MPTCSVKNCKSRNNRTEKLCFYRMPMIFQNSFLTDLSTRRQKAWYKALRLSESNDPRSIRVCEKHFVSGIKPTFKFL